MAKEGDFQRVDLKVSANCCDGCKKKVKKALINVDGVRDIHIHMSQPKFTVMSNVDVQTLTKKLAKISKHAEIWPSEDGTAENGEKKDKSSEKVVELSESGAKKKGKSSDGGIKSETIENACPPAQENCAISPAGIVHEGGDVVAYWQCNMAGPSMVVPPQYATCAHPAVSHVQSLSPMYDDYYSDDESIGCSVM